jgi:hypothetical protein
MDTNINIKTNSPHAWPSVIAGSLIGGALGYLFVTKPGRKFRRGVTHPDEMAGNIEEAHTFLESKTRMLTDQVHNILQKAKHGIEEGARAYHEAGQRFHSKAHEFHGKTAQNLNRTAVTIEQDVIHPICELGALYRGIERGIRTVLHKDRKTVETYETYQMTETRRNIYKAQR